MSTHPRSSGHRVARLAAAAASVLGLVCSSLPAVAQAADPTPAGTFAVHGCRLPDGSPAPINGWSPRMWGAAPGSNTGATINTCATGGSFAATSNTSPTSAAIPRGISVGWMFEAPTGLRIDGLELQRATYVGQDGTGPNAERIGAGVGNGMPDAPWTGSDLISELAVLEQPILHHPYITPFTAPIDVSGRSWSQAAFWIQCNPQAANPACATANYGTGTFVSRSTVTLADDNAPVLSSVSGSMTQPGPLAGSETLTVNASDAGGSGVYRVVVDVGGRELPLAVDDNGGRCRDAQPGNDDPHEFVDRRPCLTAVAGTLDVDTTRLPEGRHQLKVLVEDASGRRSLGFGPQEVTVDNVPAPIATSRPLLSGEARPGTVLVSDRGAWTGENLTYAFTWQRETPSGWEDIPGATGTTYAPTAGDGGTRIRSRVAAVNGEGSTEAYSLPTAVAATASPGTGPALPPPGTGTGIGTPPAGATTPALTPNGSGASAAARLTATFARTTKRTITVRYGRAVTITGRLLNAAGEPIAGARLDVGTLVRTVGGTYRPQGQVVSDARGDFRYVARKGPSRAIRFAYRLNLQDSDYSQTSTVELKVVPSISLKSNKRALRNRQAVRLTGAIAGAPRASRKLVEIQALDGRRWRTIASTRLRSGRFAYRYRFMRTRGVVTYAFRARVRTETGWTFASGESKAVKVTVRG